MKIDQSRKKILTVEKNRRYFIYIEEINRLSRIREYSYSYCMSWNFFNRPTSYIVWGMINANIHRIRVSRAAFCTAYCITLINLQKY